MNEPPLKTKSKPIMPFLVLRLMWQARLWIHRSNALRVMQSSPSFPTLEELRQHQQLHPNVRVDPSLVHPSFADPSFAHPSFSHFSIDGKPLSVDVLKRLMELSTDYQTNPLGVVLKRFPPD